MIYVIRVVQEFGENDFKYTIKFGYTRDLKARLSQYNGYFNLVKVLYTYPEGTLIDETKVLKYLESYRIFKNEWFNYCPEVLEFFKTNDTIEKIREITKDIIVIPFKKNRYHSPVDIDEFNNTGNTSIKFKNLVEFSELDGVTENDLENLFQLIPAKYGDYYKTLGPERMKAFSYREVLLKQEFNKLKGNSEIYDKVSEEVYKMFEVGKCYLRTDIKSALKVLYSKMGYNKTAKASDLSEYFIIKAILTRGNRRPGYEILAKK